jgi:hypothetical protein
MLDINGQPLEEGKLAQLLCEVTKISNEGVVLRVMNSELAIAVGCKHDEVLGGLVADSELTAFEIPPDGPRSEQDGDEVQISIFE